MAGIRYSPAGHTPAVDWYSPPIVVDSRKAPRREQVPLPLPVAKDLPASLLLPVVLVASP